MSSFHERIIGAAKLDIHIFEEVENDFSALSQAMIVVVLSSLAGSIGLLGRGGESFSIIAGTVANLVVWFLWAWITYLIGTRILPMPQTHADLGQLLRTTGFAAAPGILKIFGVLPIVGTPLLILVGFWMLAAFVLAVRQALDYTNTFRAVGVCLIGWIPYMAIVSILNRII